MISAERSYVYACGLDGGKHILEVVAIDSFGNESVQPLTAEITTKR